MIPQLPMNQIEDINNFEAILVAEEAQSQLVCLSLLFNNFDIIFIYSRKYLRCQSDIILYVCYVYQIYINLHIK